MPLVPVLLSGCAAAPGMYMDESAMEPVGSGEMQWEPKLIPITPKLIAEQARKRRKPGPGNELGGEQPPRDYRVGAGDVLTVTVWEHPELTIPAGEFRSAEIAGHLVDADGTIFYPYVGRIKVAGLTITEIRKALADRLKTYIQNPQVDLRVAAYRSKKAFITGQVAEPSILPITDRPVTVVEAVNLAGGAAPEADLTDVRVTRGSKVHHLDLLSVYRAGAPGNFTLREGDQVYVPDRTDNKVFVFGEVREPKHTLMTHGRMNLAEALSKAGGIDESQANPSRIYVIRGSIERPLVYQLNAASADAMLLATAFDLQKQDVVYVPPTGVARWNRVVSQILPTVQTLWQTKVLIDR